MLKSSSDQNTPMYRHPPPSALRLVCMIPATDGCPSHSRHVRRYSTAIANNNAASAYSVAAATNMPGDNSDIPSSNNSGPNASSSSSNSTRLAVPRPSGDTDDTVAVLTLLSAVADLAAAVAFPPQHAQACPRMKPLCTRLLSSACDSSGDFNSCRATSRCAMTK